MLWYPFEKLWYRYSVAPKYSYFYIFTLSRKEIQEINWERKVMQIKGGEQLKKLEAEWVGLVSKNYEIEQACVLLESQVQIMEAEKARLARQWLANSVEAIPTVWREKFNIYSEIKNFCHLHKSILYLASCNESM